MPKNSRRPSKTGTEATSNKIVTSAIRFTPWLVRRPPNVTKLAAVKGIRFAGRGVDERGQSYFRLVVGKGKGRKTLTFRAGDVAADQSSVFRALADAGAPILTSAAKNALVTALEEHAADPASFRVSTIPGWAASSPCFVLPHGIIGPTRAAKDIEFVPTVKSQEFYAKFRLSGSVKAWRKDVGVLLKRNNLAIFASSVALLSPLLALLEEESAIFVVVGAAATGKSSLLQVVSSFWGAFGATDTAMARGTAETFKNTLNNLDYLLIAQNDLGVAIDDLRSLRSKDSRAKELEDLIHSLVDGGERGRANATQAAKYRAVVLTSANSTLQSEARGTRVEVDRALLDRFIEVPLPSANCAFDDLGSHDSLDSFVKAIKTASVANGGALAVAYLCALVAWLGKDRQDCLAWLRARTEWFLANHRVAGAPDRAVRRFALAYAAGRLAIRFGLVPWSMGRQTEAVRKCLAGHVALTTTNPSGGASDTQNQQSRLLHALRVWFDNHAHEIVNAGQGMGLIQGSEAASRAVAYAYNHPEKGPELLLSEVTFEQIVKSVCPAIQAKRVLAKANLLASDQNGRFSVKRSLGKTADGEKWRANLIAIRRAALDRSG